MTPPASNSPRPAQLTAARTAVDVERGHADQRVADLRDALDTQIAELREELRAARRQPRRTTRGTASNETKGNESR